VYVIFLAPTKSFFDLVANVALLLRNIFHHEAHEAHEEKDFEFQTTAYCYPIPYAH
jgi:hypothetical protein